MSRGHTYTEVAAYPLSTLLVLLAEITGANGEVDKVDARAKTGADLAEVDQRQLL